MNGFKILIVLIACLALTCCNQPNKGKKKKSPKDGLVERYYPNGKLKLAVNYKNGKRNGLAKSYYKNGKLRQEITYVNNVKHGMVTTYYKNGRKYQETPYTNGKIQGIRKKYRMNGQLMGEIPYTNDKPCAGLVEYLLNGKKKTQFPKITFTPVDNLLKANRYSLILKISDGSRDVKYYAGELTKGGCIPPDALSLGNDQPGRVKVTYNLPPNAFMMEELHFIANVKTKLGNPYIIESSYNLAIENR